MNHRYGLGIESVFIESIERPRIESPPILPPFAESIVEGDPPLMDEPVLSPGATVEVLSPVPVVSLSLLQEARTAIAKHATKIFFFMIVGLIRSLGPMSRFPGFFIIRKNKSYA